MIEDLTTEKLKAYGYNDRDIAYVDMEKDRMLKHTANGCFLACKSEGKIYSGDDALHKYYFGYETFIFPVEHPDLIKTYFALARDRYIHTQRKTLGFLYNEQLVQDDFINSEIQRSNNEIMRLNTMPVLPKYYESNKHAIEIYKGYIHWLNTPAEVVQSMLDREHNISPQQPNTKPTKPVNKDYTHKQIAIAYFVMNIPITKDNAEKILKKHSLLTSAEKLINKRYTKANDLVNLSDNKTTDTKHLNDLMAAKRLISGLKNKKAIGDINSIITTFQENYKKRY